MSAVRLERSVPVEEDDWDSSIFHHPASPLPLSTVTCKRHKVTIASSDRES